MAIEFHCPHCSAAIRVPDQSSGRRGSCPKCTQKLLVPAIVPPMRPDASRAAPPLPTADSDSTAEQSLAAASNDAAPVFIPSTQGQPSISRKLKRKARRKKSQRLYLWGIPITCLVFFFCVVAGLIYLQEPELKGTMKGIVVPTMQAPTAIVPWSEFDLTELDVEDAKSAFYTEESFVSSQMTCRIGSNNGTGLEVNFQIGEGFSWLAVNPSANLALSDWIRSNRESLNKRRLKQLNSAGTELCKDKIRKASGDQVLLDASQYRDNIGVNSHVGGFGYAVEAIAIDRASACFHEDSNRTLYFALPTGTSRFILRGRKQNGELLFPGQYTVVIDSVPTGSGYQQSSVSTDEQETSQKPPVEPDAANEAAMPLESDEAAKKE